MKKLFLLSVILFWATIGFAQNKFKTVKRSDVIVQETDDKPVDNSQFKNATARPKYLTKTSDNQTYINLISKKTGLKVTVDENGMPAMIEGIPTNVRKGSRNGRMSAVASSAYNYLEAVKPLLKLSNPDNELEITKSEKDEIETTHVRLQQTYMGVPVYGGEMILHQKTNEDVSLLNGHFYPTPQIESVKPVLSEENVGTIALGDVGKTSIIKAMTATEIVFLKYEKPKTELIVYHQNEKADAEKLAYQVIVRPNFLERWIYVIDANSGEILDKYNHTCTLDGVGKATALDLNGISRSINTYQSGSTYNLIDTSKPMFRVSVGVNASDPQGVIWTIDASGSKVSEDLTIRQISSGNNTWNNPNGVSAHFNAGVAYDYYQNKHGRNSLNGKGGTIVSIINITDENGKGFDNAFWNGEYMGYGNGATYFKPLAGGLDVAGHEMTHGVVENTANLEYKAQSGAINESLADCFGALVENKSGANFWKLGEDVMKGTTYPTGALRDLSNPNNGGRSLNDNGYQPANMNQYYTGSEDNNGVHINSGVPNYAFYRFATSSGMTLQKAEKIYYRALSIYLTRTSKFLDLRRAVIQSATDLKASAGVTDADINNAKLAFDAVGITDPNAPNPSTTTPPTTPTTTPKADVPVNIGTEGLVSYDPVAKKLYKSSTKGEVDVNSFVELAINIVIDHKPTVPDDGSYAYFVAADGFIKRVNLAGTPKVENVSSTGVWRNVAVSKDGKKLAALRILGKTVAATDKQITVFNLVSGLNKSFTLYNPTYTQGVNTGQVQNADALEWDHQSENIVYDAYNIIKNATGSESDYWDVGFINVWNSSTNNFGTGEVDKLFTSLESGENIGNPSFSKNSTNVIAFDYFIATDDIYYVIGVNTERTDGLDFIYENNTLGYPEYSRTDDYVLYNYEDSKKILNTYQITMDKSRIKSVLNSEKYLIGNSAYAVWYTVGTRVLPTKTQQTITLTKIPDKNLTDAAFDVVTSASSGLTVGLTLDYGPATLAGKRITLNKTAGRVKVTAFQDGNSGFYAVSKADSFCVNPAKPTILVVKKSDANGDYWEYTSSSTTGNVWYRDGAILESLRGAQVVQIVSGSKFNVQVVTTDGCASLLSDTRQDAALAKPLAAEPALEASVTVSPNPSSDEIRIVVPQNIKIESAKLVSILGSQVLEKQGSKSNTMTLDISNLTKGNYILQIMTNEGIVAKKVTKE
jgi:Zn-dependent metalloprotease